VTAVNVFVRTDSSVQIGTGHVVRCLALADALRKNGASVSFICRELRGDLCDLIETEGYVVYRLRGTGSASAGAAEDAASAYAAWLGGMCWQIDAEQTKAVLASGREPVN
jgi:hypothetical protein